MTARDNYIRVFGGIRSLAERVSWATGVSNMIEWLVWDTKYVLGVSKRDYCRQIVRWTCDDAVKDASVEVKESHVLQELDTALKRSRQPDRYSPAKSTIASAREALRRAKYFSEDYLNKEFDIFLALVSDHYLDQFYGQFTNLVGGGNWFTHGNGGLFAESTGINDMQMDNLSYNSTERILIANELKLGGKKNKDQILKYALMFSQLRERKFIASNSRFLLLFIGDRAQAADWNNLISQEIDHCKRSSKSTAKKVLHPDIIHIASSTEYATITWNDLIAFNVSYASTIDTTIQQIETKLLNGFNETLGSKKFMQNQ